MLKKSFPYLLLLVLLVAALWLRNRNISTNSNDTGRRAENNVPENRSRRGFDRNIANLEYTRHAKCRMECRHITQAEVEDILQHGNINYRKSELNDVPCPTYALEGYTLQDKQHVRIVFAQCDSKTKVVTCIDLDNEFSCDCK